MHKYAQELLKLQRRFITLATTQGYRVPDPNDIPIISADSNSEDSRRSAQTREQGKSRSQDERDSEEQLLLEQRHGNVLPERKGKDQATRLREAGLMPPRADDRVNRPERAQGKRVRTGGPDKSPPRSSSSEGDEESEATAPGPTFPRGRGGRGTSDDEDAFNPISTCSFLGQPSATYRGTNPRYIRAVPTQGPQSRVNGHSAPNPFVRTGNSHNEAEPSAYDDNTRQWIAEAILQDIQMEPEELPVLSKQIKISTPDPYEGQDDVEVFSTWVMNIARFFNLTRLVGKKLDQQRVVVLGDLLKGQAREWYNAEVRSPERIQGKWTLLEVVYALQEQFVHQATAQLASEKYDAIKYQDETGVAGLANDIIRYAGCMIERPDAYSMRKKLQCELPNNVVVPLLRNSRINAENSTFSRMVQEALAIENANKSIDLHYRREPRRSDPSKSARADTPTGARRRLNGRNEVLRNRTSTAPAKPALGPERTANQVDLRESPSAGSASRAPPRATASRTANNPQGRTPIKCYGCGEMGHVRSSPECRLNKGQVLRRMDAGGGMIAESEGEVEREMEEEVDSSEPPLKGKQYSGDEEEILSVYSEDGVAYAMAMRSVKDEEEDAAPVLFGMSIEGYAKRFVAMAEDKV
jgi:hypothetical protein